MYNLLLPDNLHPEQSVYFNGALVLQAIRELGNTDLFELYANARTHRPMSMPMFVLCLDWLYLMNAITMNADGEVELCS